MKNFKSISILSIFMIAILSSCSNNTDDTETINSSEKSIRTNYENEIMDISDASFTLNDNGDISSVTLEDIKTLWESQIMEEERTQVNLIDFQVIKTYEESEDKFYYFLRTSDEDGQISTGAFLTLSQNKMMSASFELSAGGKECSCKGCPNGCELRVSGSRCSCSNCFPQNPNSKCEKTEKQTVLTGR